MIDSKEITTPLKYDMKNATFIIPIYVDHIDRLRNLVVVAQYIHHHFDTNIMICEQKSSWVKDALIHIPHEYIHLNSSTDDLLHRTKQLNMMTHQAQTDVIINCDCDVLLEPIQYVEAYEMILNNKADVVYPYDGNFLNVIDSYIKSIKESNSLECIKPFQQKCTVMNKMACGGIIFFDKNAYVNGGMENEHFISWGYEDNERWSRFKKLQYRVKRTGGSCLHLNHPRGVNSSTKHPKINANRSEYSRINRMNKEQLKKEVATWKWTVENDNG